MTRRDFLNLFTLAAIFGAAALWTVALSPPVVANVATLAIKAQAATAPLSRPDVRTPVTPQVKPESNSREADPSSARSSSSSDHERGCERMASAQGREFEDAAAWRDTLMTLTEKPEGSETAALAVRSHRPMARGVSGEKPVELGRAGIKARRHLQALATSAAHLCGVPVPLFHALIARESSWDPLAVSSSGAVGLAQVKPSTARGISPTLDIHTPWGNLVAGACYLRQQRDRFGSWEIALHAYHGGPQTVLDGTVSADSRRYAAQIGGQR